MVSSNRAELRSILETEHLLRSPKNARRLLRSLRRARRRTLKPGPLRQLRGALGLKTRKS